MSRTRLLPISVAVVALAACSTPPVVDASDASDVATSDVFDATTADTSPPDVTDVSTSDAADSSPSARDASADGPAAHTQIEHVVLIVQENHSFDSYFGTWCTGATGSNPTCTSGPSCCEAAPAHEPSGAAPVVLDDTANGGYDPNHTQACEIAEVNGGANDRFVTGASCSDHRNFAIAPATTADRYISYATQYALADRYFHPVLGQTSANDMYLARAQFVFLDNTVAPNAIGHTCTVGTTTQSYTDPTIADLLLDAGYSFAVYAEGLGAATAAAPACPRAPSDCALHLGIYPCIFDPSDIPFEYYPRFTDNPQYMADANSFAADVAAGRLPNFAYVKGLGYHTEHPGAFTTIHAGEAFVDRIVQAVMSSPQYANNTLILVTWDEAGGFYDHIAPPPDSTVDHQPYGLRVPLLAIGHFARTAHVSHVVMEHSSVVKFLEFNFLGTTGQLGGRDAVVNNIGSMLDPAMTGTVVPE